LPQGKQVQRCGGEKKLGYSGLKDSAKREKSARNGVRLDGKLRKWERGLEQI